MGDSVLINEYLCYFDGAISKNPGGKMGWGAKAYFEGVELFSSFDGCPENEANSNNVAEYKALEMILDYFLRDDIKFERGEIRIIGDSNLVIRQMIGHYRIGEGLYSEMAKICLNKTNLLRVKFRNKRISVNPYFKWVPRAENTEADELSKKGLEINHE
jgi:ribonuclease HI